MWSAIEKRLSANDVGLTGTHQAGVLVPKREGLLSALPSLDPGQRNPRQTIVAFDEEGFAWRFQFIYYNNALFGGTRNEYRITGMTRFLRSRDAAPGDTLRLEGQPSGAYQIRVLPSAQDMYNEPEVEDGVLRLQLTDAWRLIKW